MCVGVVPRQPPDAHAVGDHAGDGVGVFGAWISRQYCRHRPRGGVLHWPEPHNRLVRNGEHACGEPSELGRSLAAVDAQNVGADGVGRDNPPPGLVPGNVRPSSSKVMSGKDGQVGFSRRARTAALISARSVMVSIIKGSTPASTPALPRQRGHRPLVEAQGAQGAKQRADGTDIAQRRSGRRPRRRRRRPGGQRHLPRWRHRRGAWALAPKVLAVITSQPASTY